MRLHAELRAKDLLERVTFGSPNYDCLLEQALVELGLATNYMLDDTHPAGSVPLAKIHGSSNFVTLDFTLYCALLTTPCSMVESSFDPLPVHGLKEALRRKFCTYRPAYFPVLAMEIISAKALVLIGIKPFADRDFHLWMPVARSTASKIDYIGGMADYETLKKWQANALHLTERFEDRFSRVLSSLSG